MRLLARGQIRRQAVAKLLGPALAVFGTSPEPVRNTIAPEALPQVQLETSNVLVIRKEAIDRYGDAGRSAFVERVLVDLRSFAKDPQHSVVDVAPGRAEFIGEVGNIQVLVIVTLERRR